MNEFDRRWRICAGRARQAADRPLPVIPQTHFLPPSPEAVLGKAPSPWPALWLQLGLRALAGVTVLLALCTLMELSGPKPHPAWAPTVEDTVAQVFSWL